MTTKHDSGKRPWHLLNPLRPYVELVVDVLDFGAKKYKRDNWMTVEPAERYTDALERHLYAYLRGERSDPETGLPHLAHLVCCALFLMWKDDAMEGPPP